MVHRYGAIHTIPLASQYTGTIEASATSLPQQRRLLLFSSPQTRRRKNTVFSSSEAMRRRGNIADASPHLRHSAKTSKVRLRPSAKNAMKKKLSRHLAITYWIGIIKEGRR
ncbi:hypothetical protein B296_00034072 [Ensete ventricosum]|uniref:Uncharacterized protein n=1 Tax=Ensete ventricosum TaxID=4639 RepID=A0A426ZUJ8_ENSVE|nr:hypothetical protein B296_00034072 [Ensete ventricosum]